MAGKQPPHPPAPPIQTPALPQRRGFMRALAAGCTEPTARSITTFSSPTMYVAHAPCLSATTAVLTNTNPFQIKEFA